MPLNRVKNYLSKFPDLSIVLFDSSTHTAEMAAETLGVTVGQIAKTLVFEADGKPVLVVAAGDKKVNTKQLSKKLCVKKIRFASAETVMAVTGFPPGGVAPVGLQQSIPVYLDHSLFAYLIVYAAAGTPNSALPVSPERLQEITNAQVIDVCQ